MRKKTVWRRLCAKCRSPFSTMLRYSRICQCCDRNLNKGVKRKKWMGWG